MEREIAEARVLRRQYDALEPVELALAAACLLALDARLVAADILLRLLDMRLLLLIGGRERRATVILHALEVCIVPLVVRDRLVVELEDARRDAVEEIAVMADEQHAAPVLAQERLKPLRHADVEMVRRLVEKEEIRLAHERLRETDARLLSAGEMLDVLREIRLGKAEAERDAAQAALVVVAAEALEAVERAAVRRERLLVLRALQLLLERRLFRAERDDIVKGRAELLVERAAVERRRLLDVADRVVRLPADLARVVLLLPHEAAHERRLARAVRADEADLVTARDLEAHIAKELVDAE